MTLLASLIKITTFMFMCYQSIVAHSSFAFILTEENQMLLKLTWRNYVTLFRLSLPCCCALYSNKWAWIKLTYNYWHFSDYKTIHCRHITMHYCTRILYIGIFALISFHKFLWTQSLMERDSQFVLHIKHKKKKNSMVWVRERTIPTERPPLLGEVLPLVRIEGATWSAWRIPPAVFLGFLDRSRYFSIK
jgi:hypothetical protein